MRSGFISIIWNFGGVFSSAGSELPLSAVAEGDRTMRSREGPNLQVCDTKIAQRHPAIRKFLSTVYGKVCSHA